MSSLSDRKRAELAFHDEHRDRAVTDTLDQDTYEKLYGNRKYYSATQDSKNYVNSWIDREANGRVFLDYACGNGFNAIRAAKAGAELAVGIDISAVSVQNSRSDAAAAGVESGTVFLQADAEDTKLPDNCIDRIVCSGMLHHLDLSHAFPELQRILRPGGKILALEALDYNPAIKLYRHLTPGMRTEWEKSHILSLKDLAFAKRFFQIGGVHYWHISSILAPHVGPLAESLRRLDRVLTKIPGIRLMAWIFTFELIKRTS
jgi:ubiquinone/menaquinone biosynthesis C-methylase UbiE